MPQPLATSVTLTNVPLKSEISGIPNAYTITLGPIPEIPEIRIGMTHFPPIEMRLTELPSVRTHVPASFKVGFSILGIELMKVQLCGEAQMITEPYKPNPCESSERARPPIDPAKLAEILQAGRSHKSE
jgi:hypothetical protein